jgi:omega-6 fatty acid desaturase (delta-12 desaturase)
MREAACVNAFASQSDRILSEAEIRRRLARHAVPDSWRGYAAFAVDIAGWMSGVAGVLALHPMPLKILASLLAGAFMVNLGALAHEAAHGSMVESRLGNKLIAWACFTVILFNYRLWVFEHHHIHHAETNEFGHNSWSPLSKAEYAALPRYRRALERLYRSDTGLGFAPYYVFSRWLGAHVFPRAWVPERFVASSWRYTASLAAYAGAMLAVLACAPLYSATSALTAVLLGFAVPFLVWITTFSFSVCLQHTHPAVPWYRDPERGTKYPVEELTVHARFPRWFGVLTHFAMDHPVHHVNARIPFYRLHEAQRELAELTGTTDNAVDVSVPAIRGILRACKLYDFERRCWTDFDGNATGPVHAPLRRNAEQSWQTQG